MPHLGPLPPPARRAGAFATVAVLGFLVQAAAILFLTIVAGLHVAAATAIAVLIAIGHNFVWHERWTWADRGRGSGLAGRLARFVAATGSVSLVGTVALTTLYTWVLDAPVLIGNVLAVWTVGVLNYLMLDRVIYQETR